MIQSQTGRHKGNNLNTATLYVEILKSTTLVGVDSEKAIIKNRVAKYIIFLMTIMLLHMRLSMLFVY